MTWVICRNMYNKLKNVENYCWSAVVPTIRNITCMYDYEQGSLAIYVEKRRNVVRKSFRYIQLTPKDGQRLKAAANGDHHIFF